MYIIAEDDVPTFLIVGATVEDVVVVEVVVSNGVEEVAPPVDGTIKAGSKFTKVCPYRIAHITTKSNCSTNRLNQNTS